MPKTAVKLSMDYNSLKVFNPNIIYAQVSGYPLNSKLQDKAAFDLTIQAQAGFMHITGEPDQTPFKVGYAVTDHLTGQ